MVSSLPPGTWPATLRAGGVAVRPMRAADLRPWTDLQVRNRDWLGPWFTSAPDGAGHRSQRHYLRHLLREARAGSALPFAIEVDGHMAGQISATSIQLGSAWTATLGYWVAREVAGRGVAPTAVALLADHLLRTARLNRVEIAIRPENAASLRVAAKVGATEEGVRRRLLFVDGDWRDHRCFVIVAGDQPGGVYRGLVERGEAAG